MVWKWLKEQYADLKGHIKFAILAVLWAPMLAALKRILREVPNLPNWGAWAIVLLVSFVGFMLVLRSIKSSGKAQSTVQSASNALVTARANFDATEFFRLAYYSPLTAEVEKNVRAAAVQNEPNDPEGFLVKLIGVGLVSYFHDLAWSYVYRSQILMLMELNRRGGWIPILEAKPYYDKAATDYPEVYSHYSFDLWLSFMKQQEWFVQHPSNMLEITVRGKDFLKYLTHWGRYADARKF
jgi:hypothetical protein